MKFIFWIFFIIIVYHYFLFPLLIIILSLFKRDKIIKKEHFPSVSLIIAAYNEERVIGEKISNSLDLDYPEDSLQIIVVSDGSSDSTQNIVLQNEHKGITSIHSVERKGKTAALNHAIKHAKGEIIVFSDANSMYEKNAIKMLVRCFSDISVGGVCGRKSILKNLDRDSSKGDSLFWTIESRLKTLQSNIGSISNADGEIFAIRKDLYEEIPDHFINDDQLITLNIVKNKFRVIYEPEAISYEEASISFKDDFRVKARMVAGGYQFIFSFIDFFFPPNTFFKFQFLSHKLMRYMMPFFLFFILSANLFVLDGFYLFFLLLQLLFYLFALSGFLFHRLNRKVIFFYIPFYYCTMNIASIVGLYYFLLNKATTSIWTKATR